MDGTKAAREPTVIATKNVAKTWKFCMIDGQGNDYGFTKTGVLFMTPIAVGLVDDNEIIVAFVPIDNGLTYVIDVPEATS